MEGVQYLVLCSIEIDVEHECEQLRNDVLTSLATAAL